MKRVLVLLVVLALVLAAAVIFHLPKTPVLPAPPLPPAPVVNPLLQPLAPTILAGKVALVAKAADLYALSVVTPKETITVIVNPQNNLLATKTTVILRRAKSIEDLRGRNVRVVGVRTKGEHGVYVIAVSVKETIL